MQCANAEDGEVEQKGAQALFIVAEMRGRRQSAYCRAGRGSARSSSFRHEEAFHALLIALQAQKSPTFRVTAPISGKSGGVWGGEGGRNSG